MNSRINKFNYINASFLILTFFLIQWTSSFIYLNGQNYNKYQIDLNSSIYSSYEQISYSDNLEVDTSFDLQKRKIFDKDFVYIVSTLVAFIPLSQNKINIVIDIYLRNNLLYLFNPRAPPFFSSIFTKLNLSSFYISNS